MKIFFLILFPFALTGQISKNDLVSQRFSWTKCESDGKLEFHKNGKYRLRHHVAHSPPIINTGYFRIQKGSIFLAQKKCFLDVLPEYKQDVANLEKYMCSHFIRDAICDIKTLEAKNGKYDREISCRAEKGEYKTVDFAESLSYRNYFNEDVEGKKNCTMPVLKP